MFVYNDADSFNVKGAMVITGNGTNDVYLKNGKKINISGALSGTAKIGVSMESISGTFTTGYRANHGAEDPALYFTPDLTYSVILDNSGDAMVIESDWTMLRKQFENAQTYELITLQKDWSAIKGDEQLTVAAGKNITLDLNGHTIDGKTKVGNVIVVNGSLTIIDSSGGKGVITGGNNDDSGGVLSGNDATNGGAVYNEGTFTLDGGTIKDNTATNGAAIYQKSGVLTIAGGSVKDNRASTNGGAVYLDNGSVNLTGGVVSGNTAVREGGVFVSENTGAAINAGSGPVVQENSAPIGNNILLSSGKSLNLTSAVNAGARLDIVTKNTSFALTSGYERTHSSWDAFRYNGSDVYLKTSGGELWFRETEGGTAVNSWDELQSAIYNSYENQVIVLKSNLDGRDKSCLNVSSKTITIDLNGHIIDRHLSDDKDDGEVLNVTGSSVLTIEDRAGTGVITGGNNDDSGGGISISNNATCIIKGGSVQGNYSDSDGGGISVSGTLIMEGGAIGFNTSDVDGGGIYSTSSSTVRLDGALITGNTADNGGGLYLHGNDPSIKNCVISNNRAKDEMGGGIFFREADKTLTIEGTRIIGNTAKQDGGGIYLSEGTVELYGSAVSSNTARNGGVLTLGDMLKAENTDFDNNYAENGGGIHSGHLVELTSCNIRNNVSKERGAGLFMSNNIFDVKRKQLITDTVIEGNSAYVNKEEGGNGGGIFITNASVEFIRGSISYNTSRKSGGGVYADVKRGSFVAIDTHIDHNQTVKAQEQVDGGGIFLKSGLAEIKGGSVSYNFAKYNGGGIYVEDSAKMYLQAGTGGELCVLEHNDCDLRGGAVHMYEDGYLFLQGCIIRENDCENEAIFGSDDVYIEGTVITENNKGADVFMEDKGDFLIVTGKIEEGTRVGVKLSWHTGTLTQNYPKHNIEAPEKFFYSNEEGYGIGLAGNGEATVRSTEWVSMQNLIDSTASGGTVTLQRNYKADGHDTSLRIPGDKTLTLDLNGFTLDGGNAIGVLRVEDGGKLTVKDSVGTGGITGGKAGQGGAVNNLGTLNIESGHFYGNTAGEGGAVRNTGTLTVSGGKFDGNTASYDGGAIWNSGTLTVNSGVFEENDAKRNGGAVWNSGEANLLGGSVTKNNAGSGGGFFCASGGLNVKNAPVVFGNTAAAGKNILLSEGNAVKLTEALTDGAKLDLSTQDINSPLTNGFAASGTARSVFTYNEDSSVTLEVKNSELYYPKDAKFPDVNVWVSGWTELQNTINNVQNGSVIALNANLGAAGQKRIVVDSKKVTLELAGHVMDRHLTDDEDTGNVFKITDPDAELTIRDTVGSGMITGGYADDDGGGIFIANGATCIIESGVICGNRAESDGGGISVDDGKLIMRGGAVINNIADDTAGGIYCDNDGTFEITGATISGNLAENDGGGLNIHLSADATIENSFIINNNSRTEDGGGLRMSASDRTLKLINTAIDGNSAENEGGGVTVDHGNVEMTGGSLSGNRSENGAGVYVNGDTGFTAKEGAVISNNTSTKYGGGGITCYGDLSLTGVTVSGNSAKRNGGGIYYKNSGDNASLTNVIIRNNSNESQGGGIYLQAGTITMTNGEVSNNSCTDGGVYVTEDTDFYATGVTFDSNEATESAGGAMVTKGDDVTLTRCTVTNNITKHNGGGVYTSGDKLTLDSCTFTGNKSRSSSGGVYAAEDDLYLKGSNTFTENDAADNGAAIFVTEDATIYVQGTPVIRDNFGTSIYIDSGDRIHLNGALNAGSRLGVTLRNEFGAFTDGFNRYHSGGDPADFFFSDYGYEIYKTDNGEAALRWILEEDNGFIDRNNNIVDSNKVNGNNWMSAVSGERTINELNLVRAHDAAMNDVSGNLTSSKVKTLLFSASVVIVVAGLLAWVPLLNLILGSFLITGGVLVFLVFGVLHKTGLECAKTQYLYLDEMMEAGMRIFDLRLNNKNWEDNGPINGYDDNENLWLCHGEDPTAGCFYGEDHDDNTLSLDAMLTWSKEFLKKHPTETFLLEFSLETQDNVGYEEVIYTRLKNILKNFSYEINPSTGKPYLYLEDGVFGKYYTYWPKLKDVRGQILFRVTSEPEYSYYHKMLGGYQSTMDGKTPYYTRATADGGDSVVTPTDTILAATNSVDNHPLPMILKDALVHRNINSGTFVNTTDDPMRFLKDFPNRTTPPCELEEEVYNGTDDAKGLLTEGSSFVEKGLYHGIFGGDALTWGRIRTLWSTNFYDGFEYCTVKVKTGIEGDQQEKTYKVLKGTTITIPGSIYDNPYNGQGYFQNWKAETGDTYDWAPNYSLQNDLGFDHTRTELQSNRDWLLAQSEVVQIDPATQIAKNSTRVVEPGEQITIMDNTEFTAQWGAEPHTPIDVVWVDGDDAEGVRPEKLTVSYKTTDATGAEVVNTATVDAQSQWKTIVEAIPTEAPTVIDWNDLTGVEATGYRCEVTEKPGIGYTITLYHHPQNEVEVKGTVSWEDNDNEKNVRPESVIVYLLKDGVKVGSKTVTAADNWQYSFGTLKEFVKPDGSASYERNVYSVTEEPLRCYDAGIDDFDITNVLYIPDQSIITTEIRWRDGGNAYGERPDKITLHLYDGSTKIASQEVAVADYGTMTFAYFDVTEYEQENLGRDFDYRIEQDAIAKYAVKAGSYKRDNDVIGYANEYDNTGRYFKGHSLTLNADVNVNFYIALTPEQARNATVSFAWFDKELSDVILSASDYDSTKGYYKVICPVAVAEMTYDVIATLKLNGEEVEINRYAVASYAEVILLDNEFAQSYIDANGEDKYNQLCELMWAMLDYGGKAQKRFDRNLGNLANGGYSVLSDPVTPDMITTVPDDLTQGLAAYGLEYGYSSVVFLSGASLRHFYRVTDETLFNKVKASVKFTDNEKPDQVKEYAATPISRGGYVYFEMKDIPASKLDYQYQLQIGESSYKFSVMDSVKVLMESDPDDKTLELCKATYRYNQAANKFFGY